jgi:PAC2 family
MPIYELNGTPDLVAPTFVVALDGWVDAGGAATSAAGLLTTDATSVATFDPDELFDYRARRPTLAIYDGRPSTLTWPELAIRHLRRPDGQDVLVLTGPEPDYRWRALSAAVIELARHFGIVEWISLGAIPAAVPHTRAVPILGTSSRPGLLRGNVTAGPDGLLRVPAAAISVLDMAIAESDIPTLGYFAQVPHYIAGPYPAAAMALATAVGRHIGGEPPLGDLPEEARQMAKRLDAAAAADDSTREYIERLESMVDESRLPAGDDLISEIERFLREGSPGD